MNIYILTGMYGDYVGIVTLILSSTPLSTGFPIQGKKSLRDLVQRGDHYVWKLPHMPGILFCTGRCSGVLVCGARTLKITRSMMNMCDLETLNSRP